MTEKYQKQVYQEKMRAYLNELRDYLDKLEEKLLDDNTDVDIEVENPEATMSETRSVGHQAHDNLQAIEQEDDALWESLRSNLETAWDNLLSSLDSLQDRLVGTDVSEDNLR